MTVLNFMFDEKNIFIVTDSTFSDPNDKMPMGYCSKAFCLPHLDGIVAGTGYASFIVTWSMHANTNFCVRDIPHLDVFAAEVLSEMYQQFSDERGLSGSTTLYHFGYDRVERRMRVFVYRSSSNFQSEELAYGYAVKPPIDASSFEIRSFPDDYLPIIEAQKAADEALPVEERVGVGGHMLAYTLRAFLQENGTESVVLNTWKSSEISGYEEGWQHAAGNI
ncbi:hypothetical protein [Devosia neptuniae]|uniref:hypothetical protein n=1 Tax=Devosia neptuniae TaxID=191302 RepID=UPI0022B02ACD|nr:hypothetical protein [Devosia neptuniae]MCZ4348039.1 hypothetical protein [Devosia neptuniae]